MRDRGNRDVTVYDLVMRSNPEHAPKKQLSYFLEKIVELFNPDKLLMTAKWDRKKDKVTYIRDIKADLDNKWICLLLYFADKNGMGASFTDIVNHKQEDIVLEGDKARPESAHIIISLELLNETGISYLAIIEDSSKLNRRHIEAYFNHLFKEIKGAFK
jgi:hypothetical protein